MYPTRPLWLLCELSPPCANRKLTRREITEAPVIWSHSATRALNNISRNVPDNVLDKIGRGHGKVDGVVMVKSVMFFILRVKADSSFYPAFAAPKGEEVGVAKIADHIEHIADRIGRHQYDPLSGLIWADK